MRQYKNFDRYLNELIGDIYPQPPDPGHQAAIVDVANKWLSSLVSLNSILDVGCGQGQAIPELQKHAARVSGVTLGEDAVIAREAGYDIQIDDISFLSYEDESFDLIFARHTLEHSPMPLITLMEWHRVAIQWLCVIVPNLDAFGPSGRNHYYVLSSPQWANLLERSGWHIIWQEEYQMPDTPEPMEYRFMCEKKRRIIL